MKKGLVTLVVMSVMVQVQSASFPGMEIPEIAAKAAEIAALETEKGALLAAKETAKAVLQGFEKSSGLVIQGTRAILKGVTGAVQITGMSAHVSARELVEGKLPNVKLELILLGKSTTISSLSFDFKSPDKSIEELAKSILDKINVLKL